MKPAFMVFLAILMLLSSGCQESKELKVLNSAKELFLQGKAENARKSYESFIHKYPDSKILPDALLGLAKVDHLLLRNYDRALSTYRRIVALFPDTDAAIEALENTANLYLSKKKDYSAAIKDLVKLREIHRDKTEKAQFYQERIAWAFFQQEQYARARAAYEELIVFATDKSLSEIAQVGVADCFYVQDLIPEALAAYQSILEKLSSDNIRERVEFRIANCLEESGQLKEAKARYQKLIETYPNPEAVKIRLAGVENRLRKGVQ